MPPKESEWQGYEWTAMSVTTIGALLAAIQGSALLIALPEIMTHLQAGFMTIMWVLLGFLLITTALVPVVGRLADMFGRKNLYNAGFAAFTLGSLLCGHGGLCCFPVRHKLAGEEICGAEMPECYITK